MWISQGPDKWISGIVFIIAIQSGGNLPTFRRLGTSRDCAFTSERQPSESCTCAESSRFYWNWQNQTLRNLSWGVKLSILSTSPVIDPWILVCRLRSTSITHLLFVDHVWGNHGINFAMISHIKTGVPKEIQECFKYRIYGFYAFLCFPDFHLFVLYGSGLPNIHIYIYIFTYISIYTYIYTFIYIYTHIYIYISLFNLWFSPFFHVRCTTFRFRESSNICSLVYLWITLRINRSFIEQSTNRVFFEKQFSFPSPCKRRCSVWHWWMGPPIRSFHNLRPFKATDPARKHIKLPSSDQLTQDWVKCMTSGLRM